MIGATTTVVLWGPESTKNLVAIYGQNRKKTNCAEDRRKGAKIVRTYGEIVQVGISAVVADL